MRKVALVFILAVLAPSLVLAWLAVRSMNDQRLVLERQRTLIYQGIADALVKTVQDRLAEQQRDFAQQVESILGKDQPIEVAARFDDQIRNNWPLAEVGFVVSLQGKLYGPSLFGRPEARRFRLENDRFLCNRESVEVYWNSPKGPINLTSLDLKGGEAANAARSEPRAPVEAARGLSKEDAVKVFATKSKGGGKDVAEEEAKGPPGEAEFRQVVADSYEGTLARFLQDKLKLLFWYRSQRDPELVFGAQVNLDELVRPLKQLVNIESPLTNEVCVTLLDDAGKLVATTHPAFSAAALRPFVAAEIGERLPHWQIAVHLLHPEQLGRAATTARLTLGLLVGLLVVAIGIGSWLIVSDLRRQLTLARQKTDFVSNVSHELKTPLTSIRMFSEMLAEGRVIEPDKQRQFLQIITAEASRLTRLINNVLDFSRLERGEKKYHPVPCDLAAVAAETVETYRPHLEANGFRLEWEPPVQSVRVTGDRDALAQVLVNLLSNAEKYSGERKEIKVEVRRCAPGNRTSSPLPSPPMEERVAEGRARGPRQPMDGKSDSSACVEIRVLDRGAGVPKGCEEKIFEQFYRAHDSLASGIQGSGLGLTLARQIARAHGGDVNYESREGGGSCFVLRLPLNPS